MASVFDLHERQREAVRGVTARKLMLYNGRRA
jgi:hypothetical protein